MQFKEINKELEGIVFDSLRADNGNYFEAVIVNSELAKLSLGLERFFGQAVWPSKNQLSAQVLEAIKDSGGVRAGQTLYFRIDAGGSIFAMLWPWQDGYHITVKIIRK